jgi:NADH dehydrogenase (ubiquinone) Fe-S protein 1
MPMIIVGGNLLERSDSEVYFYYLNIKFKALLSEIKKISLNSKILNKEIGWNGFNILHKDAARVGALDIGLSSKVGISKKSKVIYIMGCDNIRS